MRISFTYLALGAILTFSIPVVAQNSALKLNGSNYVDGNPGAINPPFGAFTAEFWVFANQINDGQMHQFISQGITTVAFYLGYGPNGNIVLGDFPNDTGVPMVFGQWTHLAVVFSDTSGLITLYVNGKSVLVSPNLFWNDADIFRIGAQTDVETGPDLAQNMVGLMDELKTWNSERTAAQIKSDMFGDVDVNDPNLQLYYPMNDNGGTTVTNGAASTGGSQSGTIVGDDGSNSWAPSPISFGNNALTFDGVDDQVIIPANSSYDFDSTGGTVEFWVNPTTLSGTFSTVLGNRGPDGVRYSFHLSTTQIGIDNGTTMNTLTLPPGIFTGDVFPTGQWFHLAFVYNGSSTTAVYINGAPIGNIGAAYGTVPASQGLTLGIAKNTSGTDDRPFSGGIDEVRIWKTQQSSADIVNNMNLTLNGNEIGLIGQFSFNEGTANADNSGLITAIDNTAATNNGAITHFALTGSASNFGSHALAAVPLPVLLVNFTAVRSNNESVLRWETAQEQNTSDFAIQRSSDGSTFTTIGTVAAAGNSVTARNYSFVDLAPMVNNNYYRLKQSDLDGHFTYSPVRVVNFQSTGKLIWYATGKASAEVYLQQGSNEYYTLSDLNGRTLRQGQLSNGKTELSHLPAGVYIVKVMSASGNILITKVLLP